MFINLGRLELNSSLSILAEDIRISNSARVDLMCILSLLVSVFSSSRAKVYTPYRYLDLARVDLKCLLPTGCWFSSSRAKASEFSAAKDGTT